MKDVIRKEKHYNHPIANVWEAITKAEEISAWFIQADFEPEVGYAYTFTHEDTKVTGKVLEVNPVTRLVYTWDVNKSGVDTVVSWTLEEKNGGTYLTLEHTGISNYPTEEMATTMMGHFEKGWERCIGDLLGYLKERSHVA